MRSEMATFGQFPGIEICSVTCSGKKPVPPSVASSSISSPCFVMPAIRRLHGVIAAARAAISSMKSSRCFGLGANTCLAASPIKSKQRGHTPTLAMLSANGPLAATTSPHFGQRGPSVPTHWQSRMSGAPHFGQPGRACFAGDTYPSSERLRGSFSFVSRTLSFVCVMNRVCHNNAVVSRTISRQGGDFLKEKRRLAN